MTTIRTVATHEVVRATFPRPVSERDQVGMAAGKAIDGALAQFSHLHRTRRRPTVASVDRMAEEMLDEELEAAMVQLSAEERGRQLTEIRAVLREFRGSELMDLERPRSRLILVNGQFGIYAQPDYWDGKERFFEMKTYHADPIPPDVMLQLRLFQLAFPRFRAFLSEFDRHSTPVSHQVREIPPPDEGEVSRVFRLAVGVALASGQSKVLEYVENPIVRYSLPD
jgi:hypothetical protein